MVASVAVLLWLLFDLRSEPAIREGTQVAGVDVSGMEPDEAATALEPVARDLAATMIELKFGNETITVTAAELGISLDTKGTLKEAGQSGSAVVRPASWLFDLFASRDVDPVLATNLDTLQDRVHPYTDPETPRIELVNGVFEPVASTEVPVPDMEALAQQLEEAVLGADGATVSVEVPITGMAPSDPVALQAAVTLAAQANDMTEDGVWLRLQNTDTRQHIGQAALRNFVVMAGTGRDTRLALDERLADTLTSLFAGIGAKGIPAVFDLDDDGNVDISFGQPGFKCCHESALDTVLTGLLKGDPLVTLPATPDPHPRGREWAEALQITEVVGEFTTNFRAGQSRVTNIARIAELTRGAIIAPGEQFSVNGYVGPRTLAKGFVKAGVIQYGVFEEAVGGGISQYATTLFNAAFFAGLDFIDYQSHSIYISRYPYGREATVSHPAPDLVVENNSPYGVMLWPTTTASSVTVKLYSTPWVVAEQTGQESRQVGTSCTRVTTERTRTWLADGHAEVDTVTALYRPEGIRCDGSPSVTTTTSSVPPTTCTAGCEETDAIPEEGSA